MHWTRMKVFLVRYFYVIVILCLNENDDQMLLAEQCQRV